LIISNSIKAHWNLDHIDVMSTDATVSYLKLPFVSAAVSQSNNRDIFYENVFEIKILLWKSLLVSSTVASSKNSAGQFIFLCLRLTSRRTFSSLRHFFSSYYSLQLFLTLRKTLKVFTGVAPMRYILGILSNILEGKCLGFPLKLIVQYSLNHV
jgi:hypothetical protein